MYIVIYTHDNEEWISEHRKNIIIINSLTFNKKKKSKHILNNLNLLNILISVWNRLKITNNNLLLYKLSSKYQKWMNSKKNILLLK